MRRWRPPKAARRLYWKIVLEVPATMRDALPPQANSVRRGRAAARPHDPTDRFERRRRAPPRSHLRDGRVQDQVPLRHFCSLIEMRARIDSQYIGNCIALHENPKTGSEFYPKVRHSRQVRSHPGNIVELTDSIAIPPHPCDLILVRRVVRYHAGIRPLQRASDPLSDLLSEQIVGCRSPRLALPHAIGSVPFGD